MKFNKKKVFAVALAVCLIATLSLGTLAWFSAADEVQNDFLVADSEDDTADKIFSIDVWEKGDEEDDGLEYTNILPGDKLKKEARVENTGHYDQYVRVIVTISDAEAWIAAVGENVKIEKLFTGYDDTMWTNISKEIKDDNITYVLYYNGILESGKTIELFDAVNIPSSLTQAQAAAFKGGFSIDIKAQAVQTKNVGANAVEAFEKVGMGY